MFLRRAAYALLAGIAAPSFNPATLFAAAEPGGWWDIELARVFQDSAGTVPGAVGQPVGRVNDKSGRGNHIIQATTAAKPILRYANNSYYLEFDGVDDAIGIAAFAVATPEPFTRITSLRQVTWAGTANIYSSSTGRGVLSQWDNTPELSLYAGTAWVAFNVGAPVGADKVVSEVFNGVASSLAIDNDAAIVGNPGAGAAPGLTIGGNTSTFASVRWYGGVMVGRALTGPETTGMRSYAAYRQGRVL